MKKAFIISPIGKENSEERNHANQVFKYIIEPALDECNIKPIRADQMSKSGKITEQIYKAIQTYDMCIIVLAFNNPNVYYELAIAQCSVRPVIILIEKGKTLPFDLKDERSVFYDLSIPSYENKIYINQIIKMIENLEEADWKIPSSIPGFSPIAASKDENYQYFKKLTEFGIDTEWEKIYNYYQKIINDSNEKLYLMGITLRTWRLLENLDKTLVEKANNGCEIKILIMDLENEFLRQIHNEKLIDIRYEKVRDTLIECSKFYSQCAAQSENIEFRQIHHGRLTQNQAINDKYCVYIPHFYSILISNSPCWKFKKGSQPYDDLWIEFNSLWELNAPIKKEILEERMEEERELLKELRSKLTNVEDLIVKNNYSEAVDQLNHILESANLFNFEEIRTIAIEKLKNLRDPEATQRIVKKILEFEYDNQRNIAKAEMVTQLNIDISETDYYENLLSNPVNYGSSEIPELEDLGAKILIEFIQPTLYDLIITSNYDLETAQKIGKFLINGGFIEDFRKYPLIEAKYEPRKNLLVFISYSTKDADLFKIEEIAKTLKSYEEIKEVLYWEEDRKKNIITFMSENLGMCDVLILFCSPNAINSVPVEKEWTAADMMSKPIIPVFLKSDHIPPFLRSRLGIEFDTFDLQKTIIEIHNLILRKIKKRIIDIKDLKTDF